MSETSWRVYTRDGLSVTTETSFPFFDYEGVQVPLETSFPFFDYEGVQVPLAREPLSLPAHGSPLSSST